MYNIDPVHEKGSYGAAGIRYPNEDLFGYPDELIRARTSAAYNFGCDLMSSRHTRTVIDLGSGHGHGSVTISGKLNPELLVSADRWADFLASQQIAIKPLNIPSQPNYTCLNIPHLPFKEDSFDAVFLMHVVEHLTEPSLAIQKAISLIKPQGYLIIATPNKSNIVAENPGDVSVFSFAELQYIFNNLNGTYEIYSLVPNAYALKAHNRKKLLARIPLAREIRKKISLELVNNLVSSTKLSKEDFSLYKGDDDQGIDYLVLFQNDY